MSSPQDRRTWLQRLRSAQRLRLALGERRDARPAGLAWRIAAPAVFVLAGALFVASATTSEGTDLRAGRISDLAGLAEAEADDLEELRARQSELSAEVERLTASLGRTDDGTDVVDRAAALREPVGLAAVSGPGLTITLDDAPEEVRDSIDPSVTKVTDLVVHQQDIQAVVNALWAGGAEAMTIQGQRVVSTTGIRCVGNTVVLHDVPYAPPYVISAIGPTDSMIDAIDENPFVGFYLEAVAAYQLGWKLELEQVIEMPGYTGSTALQHARPVTGLAASS